jgi:Bifunctional DNA primase/polymerase, N-terminal
VSPTAADYVRAVDNGLDDLAAFYGDRLDTEVAQLARWVERDDALLLSALDYARRLRLRVLPLVPGAKIPLGGGCCRGTHRSGATSAGSDPEVVARWWREHPTANVGVATGHRVDVIDQDGPEGAVSWARIGRAGAWPAVLGVALTVRPEGGGVHRYVASTGDGNGAKVAPGIDYRGRGGYVVAPPSIIDGRRYAWARPLDLASIR